MPTLSHYLQDSPPPYRRRVCLPEFAGLDPLALPWREMRRNPQDFPLVRMAKISSARTVAGFEVQTPAGGQAIYLKRSLVKAPLKRMLALVRESKEWREFELALAFAAAGFVVPEPVYYSETAVDGVPTIFYATRALAPEFREAKGFFLETRSFTAEWRSLAAFARTLHARPALHADFRADHVFFAPDGWAMIDLDGSRVGKPVTRAERIRAMGQLTESVLKAGVTREDLRAFAEIYDPENQWRLPWEVILKEAQEREGRRG